ncbi:MAG: PIN domain-containing protein [Rhodospirillales bacterium]|nr:MAG: PIN domain-containing protein [Rhodospirillales bacterium]
MIFGLDTNILAYAEGVNDALRQAQALRIVSRLPASRGLIPVQALGELFRVLTMKMKRPPKKARAAVMIWQDALKTGATTPTAFQAAMDLAADHRLSIWDSLILSVAAENGCRVLLSEDMQDGFVWRGLTVVNPFAPTPSPLLTGLLQAP